MSLERFEQCSGVNKVRCGEPLSEPAADWCEKIAGLALLALSAPEPGKGRGGAQLPHPGVLGPPHGERASQAGLGLLGPITGQPITTVSFEPKHPRPEPCAPRSTPVHTPDPQGEVKEK